MKKCLVLLMSAALLLSSCGSYEAAGAYTGAQFGSIIGSAVGGITGGWRGSDVGQLVGMAGGAAVGAAIGKSADNRAAGRSRQQPQSRSRSYDESGFDATNSGDDRIVFGGSNYASVPAVQLELRNVRLLDESRDGVLSRGEQARVVFEIYNPTAQTAYNVQPAVYEQTGNRHIHISENVMVESIAPRQTIRYTAMVKADNRLRTGEAAIRVTVLQGGRELRGLSDTFRLPTARR